MGQSLDRGEFGEEGGGIIVGHAVCVDNIILVAIGYPRMAKIIEDLDSGFASHKDLSRKRYFNWKRDLLEIVHAGSMMESRMALLAV